MKGKLLVTACVLFASSAQSSETGGAWCKSFTENSGISDEPCACVIETIEAQPSALAEELYSYETRNEYLDNGSAELKEVLDKCVGDVS